MHFYRFYKNLYYLTLITVLASVQQMKKFGKPHPKSQTCMGKQFLLYGQKYSIISIHFSKDFQSSNFSQNDTAKIDLAHFGIKL
jgi:hypothetical protein